MDRIVAAWAKAPAARIAAASGGRKETVAANQIKTAAAVLDALMIHMGISGASATGSPDPTPNKGLARVRDFAVVWLALQKESEFLTSTLIPQCLR